MFERARRRLAIRYVALLAVVLAAFSLVFVAVLAVVLAPNFDLGPEVTTDEAEELAYRGTVEAIGIAVVVADLVALALAGLAAWTLAGRTLDPMRRAHERQRRFVADASHAMRTPLAAIRATSEAALSPSATTTDRDDALRLVAAQAARLTRITTDLLLLAQSDDGQLRPRSERMDLSVAVSEAVGTFAADPSVAARLAVRLATDLEVKADPDEVTRIVEGLVDNALRYGGDGCHVSVATSATPGEALVEVTDDGPGIAAVDQRHVFEPFFRVRADASAPEGSGLGLAIGASLARRNGGRLTLESRPGSGATFRLVLPRVG